MRTARREEDPGVISCALVNDLARQHEQHAATLQAQLQQQAEQVERSTEQYAHISADYKRIAELLAQA